MSTLSIFDYETSRKLYCNNCGKDNHSIKNCTSPRISLGILLFIKNNNDLKFLLVRRKDTIGYMEFLRGKYKINDINYITDLFSKMTYDEINRLKNSSFDQLWNNLWMQKDNKQIFRYEYIQSKYKFNYLKKGFYMKSTAISIEYFINKIKIFWNEQEWEIPKGRRNYKETDLHTAKREFMEETGIQSLDFKIHNNIQFIEEYIGSNNISYRHIYYIAKYIGNSLDKIYINKNNTLQVFEISKIGIFSLKECNELIRHYYPNKKEIIQDMNNFIIKNRL